MDVARSSEWNYGERSFVLSANSLSGDSVYEESTGVDSEEDAQSMYELIGHNADNERGVTLSSDFSCNRSKVIDVKEDDDAMSASQHVGTLSVHQVFHPVGPASLLLRQVANRFLRHKIGEFVGNRCTLCDEKRASLIKEISTCEFRFHCMECCAEIYSTLSDCTAYYCIECLRR